MDDSLEALLRDTARSFSLSLNLLPRATRRLIATTYLMARAADSIADTAALPPARRIGALEELRGAILRGGAAPVFALEALEVMESLSERALVARLTDVVAAHRALPEAERGESAGVFDILSGGMVLDLERFPPERSGALGALPDRAALLDYTDRVAGCVGPFWTAAHARALPGWAAWGAREDVRVSARAFGRGLQLVNILRDLPRDLAMGRCYLPRDELASLGLRPEDLREPGAEAALRPLFDGLTALAEEYLDRGWGWLCELPGRPFGAAMRVRLASGLPLVLGVATLQRLRPPHRALDVSLRARVPRRELLGLASGLALRLPSRSALRRFWRRLKSRRRSPS